MTEKRFKMKKLEYEAYFIDSQQEYVDEDEPNFKIDGEKTMSDSQILDLLNENEQLQLRLKSCFNELRVYRKIASCGNCQYHNYDWDIDDGYGGEEYEICEKGNDVTDGICEEWREL